VAATVESYLRDKKFFKFWDETEEVPSYATDLLRAAKVALNSLKRGNKLDFSAADFVEPITGETVPIY
jgi:hypothetical protein